VTTLDPGAARDHVASEHAQVVAAVETCADAVTESWDGPRTTDASAAADRLQACLATNGVLERLPDLLAGAVDAAGGRLQADPVAAPPYVVVTSRGPLLRATLDGGRLVVRIDAFRVTDDGAYERADGGVTAVLR